MIKLNNNKRKNLNINLNLERRKCKKCGDSFIPQEGESEEFCDFVCESKFTEKKYNQQNKEKHKQQNLKNPNKQNEKCGCHGSYYRKLRWLVLLRDNFQCQYCGKTPHKHKISLEVDHIKPTISGGFVEMKNLITSCSDCNIGKKEGVYTKKIQICFEEKDFEYIN